VSSPVQIGEMPKDVVWGFRGTVCDGLLIQTNRRSCNGSLLHRFQKRLGGQLKGIDGPGEVLPSNVDPRGRVTIGSLSIHHAARRIGGTGCV